MKNKMMTLTEAAIVRAVMKHMSEEPKMKKVALTCIIHNFVEVILVRETMAKSFPVLDAFDYPTKEEIHALVDKVLLLTVVVCDEYDRLHSL